MEGIDYMEWPRIDDSFDIIAKLHFQCYFEDGISLYF